MEQVAIADVMQAYALDAVAYAKRSFDIHLDYSEKSIVDVDRILAAKVEGISADKRESELIAPDKLTPEEHELWTFCKMMGGYVGEVIIRNLGGVWKMKEIDDKSSSVSLMVADRLEGSPPQTVWRALTEPYKGITGYYRGLIGLLSQGNQTAERGPKIVRIRPLSDKLPEATREQRPWWRFWGR